MKRLSVVALALAGTLAAPAVAGKAPKTVSVDDDFFAPSTLTVKAGKTVRWVWNGDAPHDVTVQKGPVRFKSAIQSDGTFSKKLKTKGTYSMLCTVHAPDMKMTLTVK